MKRTWLVPMLLVLLSVVPALGGVHRLDSVLHGAPTAETERFLTSPAPIVLHVIAATLFAVLGAFQFSAGVRARWPRWHRTAGKVLGVVGLVTALSGLWMTVRYVIPTPLQGPLVWVTRLVVGLGMTWALVAGWRSILRRDLGAHEAWMIRAYALAQGAGTQAIIMIPPAIVLGGEVLGFTRDVFMTLAWVINFVIAEWLISRRPNRAVGQPVSA